jgi:hypothetical protein
LLPFTSQAMHAGVILKPTLWNAGAPVDVGAAETAAPIPRRPSMAMATSPPRIDLKLGISTS